MDSFLNDGPGLVLGAYSAAVNGKNLMDFTDLYAQDVHVYDAWGKFEYVGAEAWQAMAADWFGSLGNETVRVDFAGVRVLAGENVAMLSAAASFSAFSADGRKLRSLTNRMTMGLELRDSKWLIVHEHSSLPVDMETGRGIFGS
ncbi:nuclear transport factor 2 family protein [Paeniglutamicibacter psychrophenolicus]|uniref:Ketosteroid isomerase-like protein n=1 Tax=Paeniglutamicibacter psychrophenolicus TaxID=257454 RepID=A0ABS4W937_9MICC|nr:nuclear transport factor 2 family protein [Paeniglutamicibacter psychrophenolicus]MBP2372717.1 ketosteroid isomerase-like protein [Paeniglutamicibacter psychrophenolicus]